MLKRPSRVGPAVAGGGRKIGASALRSWARIAVSESLRSIVMALALAGRLYEQEDGGTLGVRRIFFALGRLSRVGQMSGGPVAGRVDDQYGREQGHDGQARDREQISRGGGHDRSLSGCGDYSERGRVARWTP